MRHKLLRDGKMMWRLGGGKQVEVHVALFTDIILLMLRQEGRLVLRSQNVIVVAGKENIVHGPVIKLDKLIVQPYAAGVYYHHVERFTTAWICVTEDYLLLGNHWRVNILLVY